MIKHVFVGSGDYGKVFVTIAFDGKRLSFTGVEGPRANGNCKGGCGQIRLDNITKPAPGIDIKKLQEIWDRWHLNDMRADCEHQRNNWNMSENVFVRGTKMPVTSVFQKEDPNGMLGKPCEVCGYKYGTDWLFEEVPQEVIKYLESLPETDDLPTVWQE